jgi:hypothetical protein
MITVAEERDYSRPLFHQAYGAVIPTVQPETDDPSLWFGH